MSTQIAVRLPDDVVASVDELVASGEVRSRAELVTQAVRRDLRRRRAIADLEKMRDVDPERASYEEWLKTRSIPTID
jgi:Arc/MetJ-type ribon-helix-helix transcriptional regulator